MANRKGKKRSRRRIVMNKLEQIKKKIFMSMKIMDTSIKGVKESQDYLLAQAYNQGLRDAMSIFETELKQ
jgi:uncharacterized membrane protein YcaP (DUF421 family)